MNSNRTRLAVTAAVFYISIGSSPVGAERISIDSVGFATPESAEYYTAEDVYLVGNINGHPLDKDDNGFISRVSPDGKVLDLKWIDGSDSEVHLNAPKGLAIDAGTLYVADIDEVHLFDLPSGRQIKTVHIAGSTFLNGITANPAGGVLVTDSGLERGESGFDSSGTDAVYEVTVSGKYRALIKDHSMGHPNGIVFKDGRKVIVSFGTGTLSSYDQSGHRTVHAPPPQGSLDGLLAMDDGSLVMSSWAGAALYRLDPKQQYQTLVTDLESPADIGFDHRRSRILIPLFLKDALVIVTYAP